MAAGSGALPAHGAGDYFAILNVIHAYADALDRGDFAALGTLFHHADVYMPGSSDEPDVQSGTGRFGDFLRAAVRVYPPAGTPRTQHVTTNHQIHFDTASTARARSYFTVFQALPGPSIQPIITGIYDDRFRLIGGAWRIVERREAVTALGDLSAHLIGDASIVTEN